MIKKYLSLLCISSIFNEQYLLKRSYYNNELLTNNLVPDYI